MSILASGQLKVIPTTIFEVGGADVVPFTLAIVDIDAGPLTKKITVVNLNALDVQLAGAVPGVH